MKQIPMDTSVVAHADDENGAHVIAPDLAYRRTAIVNVVFCGHAYGNVAADTSSADWVLIDAGVPGMAGRIRETARSRFGDRPPVAIVLTHGHFDHIGSLEDLVREWNVPIYAHELELPFLNGTSSYPPPDPSVGGGMMSLTSPLFPNGPFDFSKWLKALPADGAVPGMPGWRWIHTPGHAPGHVSLWRASDRTLIAGDAFITTRQESAYAVATQEVELHGPPMYYTPDWESARASVRALAMLEPELAVTGHGRAVRGQQFRDALHLLANQYDEIAVPKDGRYVEDRSQSMIDDR
jgi:glyoxylase-like metal-dependent hydrolase (beta-lactamase superfamily II)